MAITGTVVLPKLFYIGIQSPYIDWPLKPWSHNPWPFCIAAPEHHVSISSARIHTHIHTHIHIYIHTHIHTYIHAYMHTY